MTGSPAPTTKDVPMDPISRLLGVQPYDPATHNPRTHADVQVKHLRWFVYVFGSFGIALGVWALWVSRAAIPTVTWFVGGPMIVITFAAITWSRWHMCKTMRAAQ